MGNCCGLNPYSTGNEVVAFWKEYSFYAINMVLILILLEMRLLLVPICPRCGSKVGLNPYSTGNEVVA